MDETMSDIFARYLDPDVLALLNESAFELRTEDVLITAAFLRVANFTRICRILEDERSVDLLNSYYAVVFPILLEHNATISNILGPTCFAVWGAPLAQDNHALLALQAANDLMPALREFSAEAQTRFDIEFQVHIGINSGMARVGIVGSPWLMFYTAVGWTVQLAWAVLDEAQRRGLPILFSGETRKLLPEGVSLQAVGRVVVEDTQSLCFTPFGV